MTALIPTAILLMSTAVAQMSLAPDRFQGEQQWRPEVVPTSSSDASISSLLDQVNAARYRDDPWEKAVQTVLVVPGPDLPAANLATITEDMTVMCRILDQALVPALIPSDTVRFFDPFDRHHTADRPETQGLYLDGYGALFFVQVNFPLAPSQTEPQPPKAEPSTDPVWSRAVDELRGTPQRPPQAVAEYDAQKVENLKAAVLKSLRHASNMRVRGPQDAITVAIRVSSAAGYAFVYTDQQGSARTQVEPTGIDRSIVLVLRTSKADVDALAQGGLTAEQFATKVQLLRSWTNASSQGTSSTSLVIPSATAPARIRR